MIHQQYGGLVFVEALVVCSHGFTPVGLMLRMKRPALRRGVEV
jgi:hypothetical protein